MKRFLTFFLIILTAILLVGCDDTPKNKNKYTQHVFYLEEAFSIKPVIDIRVPNQYLTKAKKEQLENDLNKIVLNLDKKFNIQNRGDGYKTELMKVNENAGIAPVKVSEEVIKILKKAIEAAELSICESCDNKALFDPTIAVVWDLWNFTNNYYDELEDNRTNPPADEDIQAALQLVDFRKIIIDEENSTVFLAEKGMKIDLGGIVKGYAADKVKEYLLSQGVTKAIIDIGGNIHTIGSGVANDGKDRSWRLGLQTPFAGPFNTLPSIFGTYIIDDLTIVTSGIYERYIKDEDGNDYHHILDPRTGYPFDNNVVAVSIITTNSMWADALSTSIFALGLDEGMRKIESMDGVEAVFVVKNGNSYEVYISSGAKDNFIYNEKMNDYKYAFKGVYKGE